MLSRVGLRLCRLVVLLCKKVWPMDMCREPRSSTGLSKALVPSFSSADRSRYFRGGAPAAMAGVAKREVCRFDEMNRRLVGGEEIWRDVSAAEGCASSGCSLIAFLMVFESVLDRDGARNLSSSPSSPAVPRRPRTRRDVFRPSSGSSVPARRVRRSNEDLLPSSGSSVPARRVRATIKEDLRLSPDSLGVDGVDPTKRGLGRVFPLRMLFLRSSNLDMVLGLIMDTGGPCSAATLDRREIGGPPRVLFTFGVTGASFCATG